MKYSEVPFDSSSYKLDGNSMASLFGVGKIDGKYVFNSNKTISILGSDRASQDLYDTYRFSSGDSWASIAYKFYGKCELWWIICKFNSVVNVNVTPNVGDVIQIPKKSVVDFILEQMKISANKNI